SAMSPIPGTIPTYATNQLNGKGVVNYTNLQQSIISDIPLNRKGFSVFLLYKPVNQYTSSPMIQAQSLTSADSFYFLSSYHSVYSNYVINQLDKYDNLISKSTQSFQNTDSNTWQLLEFMSIDKSNSNLITMYVNGQNIYSIDTLGSPDTFYDVFSSNLFINSLNASNLAGVNAQIAELVIVNRSLCYF
ncbi:hypothetical protein EB001_26600, partial [bacterium]|nr:hypothetical protein [bacterium]